MKKTVWVFLLAAMGLSACETYDTAGGSSGQHIQNLPEGVVQKAAPFQDLTAVRIDPADGCYVYRHRGPVETTYLPLRTVDGRPICTRAS
ncbi:hypothetical protein [Shimia sp. SDUM112013]|uniref:hypothetical protein n=1 Tax=Shimia sp. SDUM112013 TaxID=3136160 RepID=UPI0032EDE760